ncbi:MAG: hypothetical protein F6K36_11800 [Symploca sp. SIO3C6]|nr:hypothetical protein [Symploca sp. SIO3C6]
MIYPHQLADIESENRNSLQALVWATKASQEKFSLILARCNYTSLREQMVQKLRSQLLESCSLSFLEIVLDQSVNRLFTTLKAQLGDQQPPALMVFGLESLSNLEQVLTAANQVREEFGKNFHFPLVLWVTDEVMRRIIRLAPDFYSWATSVEFAISTDELIGLIKYSADQVFAKVLEVGAGLFLDNRALNLGIGSPLRAELEAARQELLARGVSLEPQLEASLEFVLARAADDSMEESREHYERSLELWQQFLLAAGEQGSAFGKGEGEMGRGRIKLPEFNKFNNSSLAPGVGCADLKLTSAQAQIRSSYEYTTSQIERLGCVLHSLGLWWRTYAERHRAEYESSYQRAKDYFEQSVEVFRLTGNQELVAKFINALGGVLQRLQLWQELETVAQEAFELHQTYFNPFRQARVHGFLAEVALSKSAARETEKLARQAISILEDACYSALTTLSLEERRDLEGVCSHHKSWYLFSLARAQETLGLCQESLKSLEAALVETKPHYEPSLYIRILQHLRNCYFKQGDYLRAFQFKQQQRSIEQQFSFRAFIGAGRLQPEQQVSNPILPDTKEQEKVAREIIAAGREKDIQKLVERLSRNDRKLTVIYGPSGVGKSSIVQAGLIPVLKEKTIGPRAVLPVLQQVYSDWIQELEKRLNQAITEFEYSQQQQQVIPYRLNQEAIALSCNLELVNTDHQLEAVENNQVVVQKKDGNTNQQSLILKILEQLQANANKNLLTILIFDQFEEFFFTYKEVEQKWLFYDFLKRCLDIPFLKVILSLREDYIHYLLECDRLTNLEVINNDILNKNILYYLGNFHREDARRIIQSLTSARFPLEASLIDELVADLAAELGEVRPIELQLVGAQLQADRISTLEEYRQYGSQRTLVERYLAEIVEDCGRENQRTAELVLYLLTNDNNTRPLKTREDLETDLKALAVDTAIEAKTLNLILAIFVQSGLVFLIPATPASRYQLVHDYLVDIIRQQRGIEALAAFKEEQQKRKLSEEKLHLLVRRQLKAAVFTGLILAISTLSAIALAMQAESNRQKLEKSQIDALSKASEALFTSNQRFEALQKALEAGTKLQQAAWGKSDALMRKQVMAALQQPVYWLVERNRLQGHQGIVWDVSISPDGQTIASGSYDHTVRLWKTDGTLIEEVQAHEDRVLGVTFSPDGQTLATASFDHSVKLWKVDNTEKPHLNHHYTLKGHNGGVYDVSFSPDGELIATASRDNTVKLWKRDGTMIKTLTGHSDGVNGVSFSPDGELIATASRDNTVKLWKQDGTLVDTLTGHKDMVWAVDFSPDSKIIATASRDSTVKLWKLKSQDSSYRAFQTLQGHNTAILGIDFSPDGKTIATASQDKTIKLWNLDGTVRQTLTGHTNGVYDLSFLPNGQTLVSASADHTLKLWQLNGKRLHKNLNAHQDGIWAVSFSPDGKTIASASEDNTVKLWSDEGNLIKTFEGHSAEVVDVSFSADGQTIATASYDKSVKLWNRDGNLLKTLAHRDQVFGVSFSNDGKTIATASRDNTVQLWNLDGSLNKILQGHRDWVRDVSFSPDDQIIASASDDKTVRLWKRDGSLLDTLEGHSSWVYSVSFSPDGQFMATASNDNTVKLWKRTGRDDSYQDYKTLKGHKAQVRSVSFSPNGKMIATASDDQSVRIWSRNGTLLSNLTGHRDGIKGASFSPDGKTLALASADNSVILWNLDELESFGDLDDFMEYGCSWLKDYLKNNSGVSKSDSLDDSFASGQICKGIGTPE